VSGRQELIDY